MLISKVKCNILFGLILLFMWPVCNTLALSSEVQNILFRYNAASQQFENIRPIDHQWASYIYFTKANHQNTTLELQVKGDGAIFIDQQLAFQLIDPKQKNRFLWNVDSLFRIHDKNKIAIALVGYSSITKLNLIDQSPNLSSTGQTEIINPEIKESSFAINTIQLLFISIILFFTTLKVGFPKLFPVFFNFANTFRLKPREGLHYGFRILEPFNLFFNLIYSLMLILTAISIAWKFDYVEINEYQAYEIVLFIILTSIAIAIIIPIKYVFIMIATSLFNLKSFSRIHYYDSLRIGLVFTVFLLIVIHFGEQIFFEGIEINTLLTIAFILVALRSTLLYLKLLRVASMNLIYLFSYLCTIELLPLFLLFKIIISAI